jgi:signal transduction histidine kinase/pSer/pThr/pTyr-binding forkhead associated (FHA) protein
VPTTSPFLRYRAVRIRHQIPFPALSADGSRLSRGVWGLRLGTIKTWSSILNKLYVIDGPHRGNSFALKDDITSVGRSHDNDICLSEIGVSLHHAKLVKKQDKIFLLDVSSFQGVFIDGQKIEPGIEVEIGTGNRFMVGNSVLSLQKESTEEGMAQAYPTETQKTPSDTSESLLKKHESRDYAPTLGLLLRISNIFAKSRDIRKVLDEAIDQIMNLLIRINRGAILLLDEDTGQLEEVVSKTRIDPKAGLLPKINYSRTIVDRVMEEGEAIMMPNTSLADEVDLLESMQIMDAMSVMCVPLKVEGETRGIIYVDSIGSPYGFRKEDLQLLGGLADTAAVAIQNAQLYDALKKELDERKRAEEALGKTGQALQETRDMLVQSEKLAAIGRLSAAVAHEILNPVNIISMRLQLLQQKEDLPGGVKEVLTICRNQLDRIVEFTEDLGQFSRSSRRHISMNNLNEIIQHTLLLSDPQFKEYDIKTDLNYDAALPMIPLDKDRIEQVIFNLIYNATEAMAGRETRVLGIETGLSAPGDYARVIISDTGVGIEESHMDKVFDPFFTTKDPGQGTGLGLFISYSIIHEHGGRIWAENNEWGGASFLIELPVDGGHQ